MKKKKKKNCGIVQGLWFLGIFAQKTHLCSSEAMAVAAG